MPQTGRFSKLQVGHRLHFNWPGRCYKSSMCFLTLLVKLRLLVVNYLMNEEVSNELATLYRTCGSFSYYACSSDFEINIKSSVARQSDEKKLFRHDFFFLSDNDLAVGVSSFNRLPLLFLFTS
jgi:hypothetical protein